MELVFPIVMEFQMAVLSNNGFIGREGLVNFEQIIRFCSISSLAEEDFSFISFSREMEAEDPEIARLRNQIRNMYLPPISSASSPDVLI